MHSAKLIEHFSRCLLESASLHGVELAQRGRAASVSPIDERLGAAFVTTMRELGERMDDAFYGLASSPLPVDAPQFGLEIMLLGGTLGEALDRYFRFHRIVTDGLVMTLETDGREAVIGFTAKDPARDPRHFLIEWYAARITSFAQWLTGHELPELKVAFAHARQLPPEAYVAALGEHVAFGETSNRIMLPRRYLGLRIIRTNEDLDVGRTSERYDPEHKAIEHRRWGGLIKTIIRDTLLRVEPLPSMDQLSRQMGVSGQTLRRNLKAEGTSYRAIKADARREIVLASLADPSLSISEISQLAGFSEPNGLLRAMKSWTGLSLSAYRRKLLKGEPFGADDASE